MKIKKYTLGLGIISAIALPTVVVACNKKNNNKPKAENEKQIKLGNVEIENNNNVEIKNNKEGFNKNKVKNEIRTKLLSIGIFAEITKQKREVIIDSILSLSYDVVTFFERNLTRLLEIRTHEGFEEEKIPEQNKLGEFETRMQLISEMLTSAGIEDVEELMEEILKEIIIKNIFSEEVR